MECFCGLLGPRPRVRMGQNFGSLWKDSAGHGGVFISFASFLGVSVSELEQASGSYHFPPTTSSGRQCWISSLENLRCTLSAIPQPSYFAIIIIQVRYIHPPASTLCAPCFKLVASSADSNSCHQLPISPFAPSPSCQGPARCLSRLKEKWVCAPSMNASWRLGTALSAGDFRVPKTKTCILGPSHGLKSQTSWLSKTGSDLWEVGEVACYLGPRKTLERWQQADSPATPYTDLVILSLNWLTLRVAARHGLRTLRILSHSLILPHPHPMCTPLLTPLLTLTSSQTSYSYSYKHSQA